MKWGCREGDGGPGCSHHLSPLPPMSAQPCRVAVGDCPLSPQVFGMWPLPQPVPLKPARCKHPPCLAQKPAVPCPCAGLGDPGGTWRSAPCPQGCGRGDCGAQTCFAQMLCPGEDQPELIQPRGFTKGDSEQPMRPGEWAGGRRRGSAELLTDQSSCNHQRLSIFSHFSYENQTEKS